MITLLAIILGVVFIYIKFFRKKQDIYPSPSSPTIPATMLNRNYERTFQIKQPMSIMSKPINLRTFNNHTYESSSSNIYDRLNRQIIHERISYEM